jgi:phospholipid/cholesterol/gamma-HCH transport system permease protein
MKRFLGAIGQNFFAFLTHLGRSHMLLYKAGVSSFIGPLKGFPVKRQRLFYQMMDIGIRSIPITQLVALFVGMILAMQTAYQLKQLGALMYVGSLVGVAMTRELAPLLTALMVAGRVGASITAELGTMKVSEEIDALDTMGLDPVKFLVVPRLLAILIMLPCLTIMADIIGMFGGFVMGVFTMNIDPMLYIDKTIDALVAKDIITGLIKSFFFAAIIGMVSCYQGIEVKGGAEGVGRATTKSVVVSMIAIIVADVFFTALFYFVFP